MNKSSTVISEAQRQLIRDLGSTFTAGEIVQLTGIAYHSVRYHLIRGGFWRPFKSGPKPDHARTMAMVALYLEGQTMDAIGQKFGVSREWVRQLIKREGVTGANSCHIKKPKPPKFKLTDTDKFWRRVNKTPGLGPNGDCWFWTGTSNGKDGYAARCRFRGQYWSARRLVLFLRDRKFPDCEMIGTSCGQGKCVNPDHMIPGTRMEIMIEKSPVYQQNKRISEQRNGQPVGKLSSDHASSLSPEVSALIDRVLNV